MSGNGQQTDTNKKERTLSFRTARPLNAIVIRDSAKFALQAVDELRIPNVAPLAFAAQEEIPDADILIVPFRAHEQCFSELFVARLISVALAGKMILMVYCGELDRKNTQNQPGMVSGDEILWLAGKSKEIASNFPINAYHTSLNEETLRKLLKNKPAPSASETTNLQYITNLDNARLLNLLQSLSPQLILGESSLNNYKLIFPQTDLQMLIKQGVSNDQITYNENNFTFNKLSNPPKKLKSFDAPFIIFYSLNETISELQWVEIANLCTQKGALVKFVKVDGLYSTQLDTQPKQMTDLLAEILLKGSVYQANISLVTIPALKQWQSYDSNLFGTIVENQAQEGRSRSNSVAAASERANQKNDKNRLSVRFLSKANLSLRHEANPLEKSQITALKYLFNYLKNQPEDDKLLPPQLLNSQVKTAEGMQKSFKDFLLEIFAKDTVITDYIQQQADKVLYVPLHKEDEQKAPPPALPPRPAVDELGIGLALTHASRTELAEFLGTGQNTDQAMIFEPRSTTTNPDGKIRYAESDLKKIHIKLRQNPVLNESELDFAIFVVKKYLGRIEQDNNFSAALADKSGVQINNLANAVLSYDKYKDTDPKIVSQHKDITLYYMELLFSYAHFDIANTAIILQKFEALTLEKNTKIINQQNSAALSELIPDLKKIGLTLNAAILDPENAITRLKLDEQKSNRFMETLKQFTQDPNTLKLALDTEAQASSRRPSLFGKSK